LRSTTFMYPVFALALAALTTPAFATIQFSYCNIGCTNTNTGMTYAAFQAVTSGLTFPASPITFDSANLSGLGIYTDPASGAIFTGFNNTTQEPLIVSGADLSETGTSGQDRPIQIDLPGDTYAIALFLSSVSGFAGPNVGINTTLTAFNTSGGDYELSIANSGSAVFFGLVSTTPIAQLFIGSPFAGNNALRILSFETGQDIPVTAPEPSTFVLLGGGLLAIRLLRKPAFLMRSHRKTEK